MKEAVRWASAAAEGMARDPPGWKSFWMSIRSRVVMVALGRGQSWSEAVRGLCRSCQSVCVLADK